MRELSRAAGPALGSWRVASLLACLLLPSAPSCGQKSAPDPPPATASAAPAEADVPTLLREARAAVTHNPKRAASLYRSAYATAPDTPGLRRELGAALLAAGDLTAARDMAEEALAHATDAEARGTILYDLGRIAEARGERDDAIAQYRASLAAHPNAEARRRLEGLGAAP